MCWNSKDLFACVPGMFCVRETTDWVVSLAALNGVGKKTQVVYTYLLPISRPDNWLEYVRQMRQKCQRKLTEASPEKTELANKPKQLIRVSFWMTTCVYTSIYDDYSNTGPILKRNRPRTRNACVQGRRSKMEYRNIRGGTTPLYGYTITYTVF